MEYLIVTLKIVPKEGLDLLPGTPAEQVQYLIEHYGTNIPGFGFPVEHGPGLEIGRVVEDLKVSIWPKSLDDPDS